VKKPIIAAIHGFAYGGGCEAVVNCDLVFASADHASFGFPEVKRGVFASAGAMPWITRTIGKHAEGHGDGINGSSYFCTRGEGLGIR
jgi:enoyl-CoA hydratase/carnithine racemase